MFERLEEIRLNKGFSKKDFSQKLEITEQAYNNYSKGKRNLQAENIQKLKQLFNISIDWLFTGEGNMYSYNQGNIDYKKEILNNLELLNENQIKYIYHLTEAEKIKNKTIIIN